jgi:hypothetical protein
MTEQWLPVVGWEGLYEVSDAGNVRSLTRTLVMRDGSKRTYTGKLLALSPHPRDKHLYCMLHSPKRNFRVHQLVMRAFSGECPPGQEVRHLNGRHEDNRRVNLAYGTRLENNLDTVRHGQHNQATRPTCKRGHRLSGANLRRVPSIPAHHRVCDACFYANQLLRGCNPTEFERRSVADTRYRLTTGEDPC